MEHFFLPGKTWANCIQNYRPSTVFEKFCVNKFFKGSRNSVREVSCKKGFLKTSQNSQENTRVRVSFLIKLHALRSTFHTEQLWCLLLRVTFALAKPFLSFIFIPIYYRQYLSKIRTLHSSVHEHCFYRSWF